MKQNYIDEKGNYHNELNLTLAQIYDSGVDFGRSIAKADFKAELEKIKLEFLFKCKENLRFDNDIVLECFTDLVDKKISELKGEKK